VSGGLYWTIAGALVGVFAGASVGSKLAERVTEGPLYASLLPAIPLPKGQAFNLATGLLAAAGGLFLGACVGMVAGSIFAGIAAACAVERPELVEYGLGSWVLGGVVLGALLAVLFSSKRASESRAAALGSRVLRAAPLSGLPLLNAGFGGAAFGGGLALLAWALDAAPGGFLYWTLAGAGMGGIIGAKLWALVER
jgi:hypothetical protein